MAQKASTALGGAAQMGVRGASAAARGITAVVSGLAKVAAATGPVGVGLAVVAAAASAGALMIFGFNAMMARSTETLRRWNGEIAAARALGSVIRMAAQQRQAAALGPALARGEIAGAQISSRMTDIGTAFKEPIYEAIAGFKETIVEYLDRFGPTLETIAEAVGEFIAMFVKMFELPMKAIIGIQQAVLEFLANTALLPDVIQDWAKAALKDIEDRRREREKEKKNTYVKDVLRDLRTSGMNVGGEARMPPAQFGRGAFAGGL